MNNNQQGWLGKLFGKSPKSENSNVPGTGKSIEDMNASMKMLANMALGSDPPNYERAFTHFKMAAEEGNDAEAQYNLATFYATGRGTEKNFLLAAYWYNKAFEQGDPEAEKRKTRATWDYFNGNIDQWNEQEFFEEAVGYQYLLYGKENAVDEATDQIEDMADNYHLNHKDYPHSLKCYRTMAEFGNSSRGMFNLGINLLRGYGTERNDLAALYWFDKAADLSNEQAKQYRDGIVDAYMLQQNNGPIEAAVTIPGKMKMEFEAKSVFDVLSLWCKFGSDGVMLDEEKSKYWKSRIDN